jgi:hypothetical protein
LHGTLSQHHRSCKMSLKWKMSFPLACFSVLIRSATVAILSSHIDVMAADHHH